MLLRERTSPFQTMSSLVLDPTRLSQRISVDLLFLFQRRIDRASHSSSGFREIGPVDFLLLETEE